MSVAPPSRRLSSGRPARCFEAKTKSVQSQTRRYPPRTMDQARVCAHQYLVLYLDEFQGKLRIKALRWRKS